MARLKPRLSLLTTLLLINVSNATPFQNTTLHVTDRQQPTPPFSNTSTPLADLQVHQQSSTLYPLQKQTIWVRAGNAGPSTEMTLVLESPPLKGVGLSITHVSGGCEQTGLASERIRCEWRGVKESVDFHLEIGLRYDGFSSVERIEMPLTLTAYLDRHGPDVSFRRIHSLHWKIRYAERYEYNTSNNKYFPHPSVIRVKAVPRAADEARRLRQWFQWADFEPTGFYLRPQESLQMVVLGGSATGPRPDLLIGTPGLVNARRRSDNSLIGQQRIKPLKFGVNRISCPVGGIMYIRYAFPKESIPPPDVTVVLYGDEAAQPFPLFRQGITTDEQWGEMLRVTNIPYAELSGRRVMVTGLAEDAQRYAWLGQKQDELLETYESIINAQDRISGLFRHGSSARHRPSPLRPMVMQTSNGRNAHAWHLRAALPAREHQDIWRKASVENSWQLWHELGHQRQHIYTWSWPQVQESTVNIYALASRRMWPQRATEHGSSREWDEARRYLAERTVDFDHADHFVQLAMFDQLRQVFGDDFYHQLHALSRQSPTQRGPKEKKNFFMTRASLVARQDLSGFFEKWGMEPDEETLSWMRVLPEPRWDYTLTPAFVPVSVKQL
ncbi:cell wall associated protein [Ophiocordyceps camponoti-floridani]|uniref:Cell wall associated protein n=1 Tax=Ophiocordyceps camponoti-floridani TaxID=2030778 RepID=A0A8H4Q9G8_9HYPO|nr:cell wall associated protein [Ophiocordyceps camponoti-floridani]